MQDDLKVTAVLPCHNHAEWVCGALDSVDRQDYTCRVVLVDDGSTDGSTDRVLAHMSGVRSGTAHGLAGKPKLWQGKLPGGTEATVLRYPTAGGPSFARNRGIDVALNVHNAHVVAFLDTDDEYLPGKIRKSLEVFQKHSPTVGVVYTDYDTLRPDGVRIREFKEPYSRERLCHECILCCDSLVLADAIRTVGGFDEEMRVCEDYDLWMRISERYLMYHIPESLITIRAGRHGSSSTVPRQVWEQNWRRVVEKAQARANGG